MCPAYITASTLAPRTTASPLTSRQRPSSYKLLPLISSHLPLPPFLLSLFPSFDLRDIPLSSSPTPLASLPLPYSLLPPSLSHPLRTLAGAHMAATGDDLVLGRVALVRGTPCPRWHVDKVRLRGLSSLQGPGCEMLVEERLVQVEAGEGVLMQGAGLHGEDVENAVLHRSPRNDDGVRVIVQTDCKDCIG